MSSKIYLSELQKSILLEVLTMLAETSEYWKKEDKHRLIHNLEVSAENLLIKYLNLRAVFDDKKHEMNHAQAFSLDHFITTLNEVSEAISALMVAASDEDWLEEKLTLSMFDNDGSPKMATLNQRAWFHCLEILKAFSSFRVACVEVRKRGMGFSD